MDNKAELGPPELMPREMGDMEGIIFETRHDEDE